MEYLTRTLKQLDKIHDFNYHTKCVKLKITSLSFADVLLLFSIGDMIFFMLMMKHFNKFIKSTGLKMNTTKCSIYFGGVYGIAKDKIKEYTGFKEGNTPFRYLGIPMINKKLVVKHYLLLTNKITHKIAPRSSKPLTYAGHIQLIQSVAFAIAVFWMQCLPLPKVVIHKIMPYVGALYGHEGKSKVENRQ